MLNNISARQKLQNRFQIAYHAKDAARAITEFLHSEFPNVESRHLTALYHFCRAGQPEELPGMVYGMIASAWVQFLDEKYPQEVATASAGYSPY